MKGYLTTAVVCIILGVMMSVYFGTSEKVYEISQVLALKNEKAANIELQMSEESLKRMKLDTELKRLEFEVSSRQVPMQKNIEKWLGFNFSRRYIKQYV